MSRQLSAKAWVAGTALLSVLLLAAAWLLLIDPVVARASEDAAQAEQQRQQNDLLELEIARLKEEFTHLDEYKAELAGLRLQMPVTGDGASISRELQTLATAAGVTILDVAPSVPQAFVGTDTSGGTSAAAAPADDAATSGDSSADDATATDSTSSGDTTTAAIPGFYAVPITLTSLGSYDSSVAFLRSVQTQASRLYLVASINAVTQDAEGASGGRPATAAGDIELTITGYAYILTDGSVPATDPAAGEVPLPTPGAQGNPFAPVG